VLFGGAGVAEAEAATLIRSDLDFVLEQIKISENHAAGGQLSGTGPNQISNPLFPYGLRTVDGEMNNLIPGQKEFGAADNVFERLVPPLFRPAEDLTFDPDGPGPLQVGASTSYEQKKGIVEDSQPRTISNLIVDQTENNPAAVTAAEDNEGSKRVDHDNRPETPNEIFLPNRAPDEGLSAPYNSWFTLFGQFFDHGLDLVTKGNSGTVFVPLKADDPLIVGADGEAGTADDPANPPPPEQRFMVLTRASNLPGPDGIVGDNPATPGVDESADDIREHTNTTTSFVDQNQTYTSHPSHQVFLREYELNADGDPVSNGKMLDQGPDGGIANWAKVKDQARDLLGIELRDEDVLNVPLLATDQYGRFLPGPNGFPQIVRAGNELVEGDPTANDGKGISTVNAVRTNHAFLDDIAHHAVPFGDHDGNPGTPRRALDPDATQGTEDDHLLGTYDDELLNAHFITGDGRGNENIGLTAVHHVFHSEHNRLVGHVKDVVLQSAEGGNVSFLNEWLKTPVTEVPADRSTLVWNGERLFQAARFATEMQYQHLVFEEFARKVQPQVNLFAGYQTEIDPSIVAEFAHTVYRFGHSMLTDTVARKTADNQPKDISLLNAFLNPLAFADNGDAADLTPSQATGAIVRGMTQQRGNEIDEFVTEALRSNLLGLPLDLATINMTRARETGVPSLNAARRKFHKTTSHSALAPYESWADFRHSLRHPESLVNFVAAYGKHDSITEATSLKAKREAATLLVLGGDGAPADRLDFLNSEGTWANDADGVTNTGLDDVDFWIGGLAEKQMPFGGLLGSTFNFVFETQMEKLQDGDRFYYLGRTAGLNFLTQLEESSFSELVMRNTDTKHLPFDIFSSPDLTFELGKVGSSGPITDDPDTEWDESALLERMPNGTVRFSGGEHIVMGGTEDPDKMRADDGDDTLWGDGGGDHLEGGAGNDALNGNAGDDIITDLFGDDNIKGGDGDDAINAGSGLDLILGGFGDDFVRAGADPKETFSGGGDDIVNAGDSSDTVFGGEGDDWIEGGDQADLLQGGNGDPFQDDRITGDDVIIGEGGNDDFDSEGGNDIMVTGPGIERNEGMLGFDWVTHKGDPQPSKADMDFTGLQPPDEDNVRDRFDQVEGLSGWKFDDTLRGDAVDPADQVGNELANAEQINRIAGLQDVLGAGVTEFTGGNIILGGEGSDLIEGRGGNDIIDGDRWLDVELEAPDPDNPGTTKRVDDSSALQADVFAGRIDPGEIKIVREVKRAATPGPDDPPQVDTAEFSDVRANYTVTVNPDNPELVTVVHTGGTQVDGSDTLRNVERLRFSDQTVEIVDVPGNSPPAGLVGLNDATPAEDQQLTASESIVDADGINRDTLVINWQAETRAGIWTTVGSGETFTPGDEEVGQRLRLVVEFRDHHGVQESVTSAATAAVTNVNDAPTGEPRLDDTNPQQGRVVSSRSGSITDRDGLEAVTFSHQWQQGDGTNWTNIAGATGASFAPNADQVGQRIRVVVSYTDNNGTLERVPSAATAVVTAPPAPIASRGAEQAPPSGGSDGGGDAAAGEELALTGTSVPRTLSVRTLLSRGLTVRFTAPARTKVVRMQLVRNGKTKPVVKVFVKAKAGKTKMRLRQPALIRALRKGGKFRLKLTPGVSRKNLGATTVKKITVRR
jgi:Ca2+-binding RTX toxin-like protein